MLSTGGHRPVTATQPSVAARSLHHAENLAREGQPGPAQALYVKIQGDFPNDPAAPRALYELGILQADPTNPLKDYRAARATFTRLLTEYPRSPWNSEARAWQATLTELLLREDEARRVGQRLRKAEDDVLRIRTGLERLKQTDLESERRR
jgi:TolA-binding protein